MMKRVFSVVFAVLLFAASAFALSDAEYKRMKKESSAFAKADKELTQAWNEAKKVLGKSDFNRLTKEQRNWIASGRDDRAEQLMDDGTPRDEAYAAATRERVKVIRTNIEIARNKARGDKPAKQVNSDHFYAIYEREDTAFMEINGDSTDMTVKFSDHGREWEGEGTIKGQKLVLTDDEGDGVTLTFKKWKDGLITVIEAKGNEELDILDGTYKAYQGHL